MTEPTEGWKRVTLEEACTAFSPPMGPVYVFNEDGNYFVEVPKHKLRIPAASKRHSIWLCKTLFRRNATLQKELDQQMKPKVEYYPRTTDSPWPWAEIGGEG